jgi:AraC-like DNA-binding protein
MRKKIDESWIGLSDDYSRIYYILDGHAHIRLNNGNLIELEPDYIYLLPPGSFSDGNSKGFELYWTHFKLFENNIDFFRLYETRLKIHRDEIDGVDHFFSNAIESDFKNPKDRIHLQSELLKIIQTFLTGTTINEQAQQKALRLQPLIKKLQNHIYDLPTVVEMARRLSMDKAYFSRFFKEVYKVSPKQYCQQLRMKEAARLLIASELQISEIAYKLGFFDPFHFSKIFKNHTGLTPRIYRNTTGKNLL